MTAPAETQRVALAGRYASRGWWAMSAAALSLILIACGQDSGDPAGPGTPSVFVIQQPDADTIEAVLSTPLVLEFRGADSRIRQGAEIYFSAVDHFFPEVLVAAAGTTDPDSFSGGRVDTTDSQGRVAVQVRLGQRAPVGRLIVSVDPHTETDTLSFTVRPGAAVAVRMVPKDTTVYVDRTLQLRGQVVDRGGNARNDAVTYEAGPSVVVNGSGVVTPSQYARTWAVVHGSVGQDTGYISVVPHGRALGASAYEGGGPIHIFELDGSRMDSVPVPPLGKDVEIAWSPDGERFVYSTFSLTRESGGELFVADLDGNTTRVFPAGTFRNAAYPRYSGDGAWIYFSAQQQPAPFVLWRVRPDGTDAENLGGDLGEAGLGWRSDPSPDGTSLVFTTLAGQIGVTWGVRRFDLATRQASAWILPGLTGRWSPAGDRIAIAPDGSGAMVVADPDGSNSRPISGDIFDGSFDWSPDGQWLLVAHDFRLVLLQVDTGLELPLAWGSNLRQPSWQP